jgi:hypothetical protein
MRSPYRDRCNDLQQENGKTDDRDDDEPIQDQIAHEDRHRRPAVGRGDAKLRRQIVAVGPQPRQLRRFDVRPPGPPGQIGNDVLEAFALAPSRQPRAEIAAAGNRREVFEVTQQGLFVLYGIFGTYIVASQRLCYTETEGCTANAAAGTAHCAAIELIERAIERLPPINFVFNFSFVDHPAVSIIGV